MLSSQQPLQLHGLLRQLRLGLLLGHLVLLQALQEAVELLLLEPQRGLELGGLLFLVGQPREHLFQRFLLRGQVSLQSLDLAQLLAFLQARPGQHAAPHQPGLEVLEGDIERHVTPGTQGLHPAHLLAEAPLEALHLTLDPRPLAADDLHLVLGLVPAQAGALHLGLGPVPLQRDALDLHQHALAALLQGGQLLVDLPQPALDGRQLLPQLRRILGALGREDRREEDCGQRSHAPTSAHPPEAA